MRGRLIYHNEIFGIPGFQGFKGFRVLRPVLGEKKSFIPLLASRSASKSSEDDNHTKRTMMDQDR